MSRLPRIPIALALLLTAASAPAPALARALLGVSCQEGFFVRAPDRKIFWIDHRQSRKIAVHSGPERLVALTQCESGVLAVFGADQTGDRLRAVYSPDCLNLSQPNGESRLIFEGEARLKRFAFNGNGVALEGETGPIAETALCRKGP